MNLLIKAFLTLTVLLICNSCLFQQSSSRGSTATNIQTTDDGTDYDTCLSKVTKQVATAVKANPSLYTLAPGNSDAIEKDVDDYVVSKNPKNDDNENATYCTKNTYNIKIAVLDTYKGNADNTGGTTCVSGLVSEISSNSSCQGLSVPPTTAAITEKVSNYISNNSNDPETYCLSNKDLIKNTVLNALCPSPPVLGPPPVFADGGTTCVSAVISELASAPACQNLSVTAAAITDKVNYFINNDRGSNTAEAFCVANKSILEAAVLNTACSCVKTTIDEVVSAPACQNLSVTAAAVIDKVNYFINNDRGSNTPEAFCVANRSTLKAAVLNTLCPINFCVNAVINELVADSACQSLSVTKAAITDKVNYYINDNSNDPETYCLSNRSILKGAVLNTLCSCVKTVIDEVASNTVCTTKAVPPTRTQIADKVSYFINNDRGSNTPEAFCMANRVILRGAVLNTLCPLILGPKPPAQQ